MDRNANRRSSVGDPGPVVRTDWSTGPRTPAWDRLWRTILGGLDPVPPAGTGQHVGREGDDG